MRLAAMLAAAVAASPAAALDRQTFLDNAAVLMAALEKCPALRLDKAAFAADAKAARAPELLQQWNARSEGELSEHAEAWFQAFSQIAPKQVCSIAKALFGSNGSARPGYLRPRKP